jgi:hypothetical protein
MMDLTRPAFAAGLLALASLALTPPRPRRSPARCGSR